MLIQGSDKFGKCIQLCDDGVHLFLNNIMDSVMDQVGGGESWVRFPRGGAVQGHQAIIFIITSDAHRKRGQFRGRFEVGREMGKVRCRCSVTVSPSPQSQIEEEEKLHALREYARDFRRQHTTDTRDFYWDLDDEDYSLAIGRLVVT
jgi:hypothetical protein